MQEIMFKKYPVLCDEQLRKNYPNIIHITSFIDSSINVRDVHYYMFGFSSVNDIENFLYKLKENDEKAISLYKRMEKRFGF